MTYFVSAFIVVLFYLIFGLENAVYAEDGLSASTVIPAYVLVNPKDSVTFSSETIATIQSIKFKEGDRFKIGDILITFDCRAQEGDLKKTEAQVASAKSAAESAEKMKSYGLISDLEYIKAKSELEMANGEAEKAASYFDKCTIEAPFNGGVSEVLVHKDETVKPGDPLLKIVNTENLELEMQVPSIWLNWLHVGSAFIVNLNETKEIIHAKVTKINPEIDSISQTIKITGVPLKKGYHLLPGMSGQAIFKEAPFSKPKKKINNPKPNFGEEI